ncbi:hypothetical protein D3C71_2013850 [compost metagenome]
MFAGLEFRRPGPVQQQEGAERLAVAVVREQRTDRKTVANPVLARCTVDTDNFFHDALQGCRSEMVALDTVCI